MNNRTFLDIDDSILTRNLTLPENALKDDIFAQQSDSKPYFIIQPEPGICIKTKYNGEKVFLNICRSDKLPSPEDISDTELYEILSQENPQFVIPMSIGSERLETDKAGSPIPTYDIVINSTYFKKCKNNKVFLMFTISVIMDGVSNKFKKPLTPEDYVILKNRKAMGRLQQHRIENREPRPYAQTKRPLIEEIKTSYNRKTREEKDKDNQSKTVVNSKQKYVLLKQPSEGAPVRLIGLFEVPIGVTSQEIEVFIDKDRIVIIVEKSNLTYDLSVLYTLSIADVKCFLDKDLGMLRLDMPVESSV